jgi:hypothetical protein
MAPQGFCTNFCKLIEAYYEPHDMIDIPCKSSMCTLWTILKAHPYTNFCNVQWETLVWVLVWALVWSLV